MKKIGILYGTEQSFPAAVVRKINQSELKDVRAEFTKVGALKMDDIVPYNVILDRVSHEVPFYRSLLKLAVLNGVHVINNPFWLCVDNNFLHAALANKINVPVPKTVILPSKEHPPGTSSETMQNLRYPLEWDEVFDYVGFPAYLKPNVGFANQTIYKVYNPRELFSAYDLTGNRVMILQESIEFEKYYRCYVIGAKHVKIMSYDPNKPYHLRYVSCEKSEDKQLYSYLEELCVKICLALGFEFNAVEFAVRDGVPYAVDFLNPAPDVEQTYMVEENFEWLVSTTAEHLVEIASTKHSNTKINSWHGLMDNKE